MRHNIWIWGIGNNEPLTATQVMNDIEVKQEVNQEIEVKFALSKRDSMQNPTSLERHWAIFEAMAFFSRYCQVFVRLFLTS